MSIHINKFIDRIKAADSRQQRDVTMSISEARDLHGDITRLLMVLEQLLTAQTPVQAQNNQTNITLTGGSF